MCQWTPGAADVGIPIIFATFVPSSQISASQQGVSIAVTTNMPTQISLAPSASSPGQTVQYTATVSDDYSGGPTPTGTVAFSAGTNKTLCDAAPVVDTSGGFTAVCSASFQSAGSYQIAASYSGDGGTDASQTNLTEQVSPGPMALNIQVPPSFWRANPSRSRRPLRPPECRTLLSTA